MKIDKKLTEAMLRKANYRIGGNLNEATYNRLDLSEDEFDEVPETPQEEPKTEEPNPMDDTTPEGEPPVPEFDRENPEELPIPDEGMGEPEPEVDEIQNEIIKHNIEAMKGIHSQIESLTDLIQSLSTKFDVLNADVEEVREPSNVEKLMSQKEQSFPFSYNLNDYWGGNWFQEQYGQRDDGIRELPDGTYIASFDDLPKQDMMNIEKSFDY